MGRISSKTETESNKRLRWLKRNANAYAAAKDFDTSEWLLQVALRRDLHLLLDRWLANQEFCQCGLSVGELIAAVQENPIAKIDRDFVDMFIGEDGFVYLPSCNDVLYCRDNRDRYVTFEGDPDRKIWGSCFSATFQVELDVPDKILLDHFERELKIARRLMKASNPPFIGVKDWNAAGIKRELFRTDRWFEMGLLPYLDVLIWRKYEHCNEIPSEILRKTIFGRGEAGRRHTISAVTKANAESLLAMEDVEFSRRVRATMHSLNS